MHASHIASSTRPSRVLPATLAAHAGTRLSALLTQVIGTGAHPPNRRRLAIAPASGRPPPLPPTSSTWPPRRPPPPRRAGRPAGRPVETSGLTLTGVKVVPHGTWARFHYTTNAPEVSILASDSPAAPSSTASGASRIMESIIGPETEVTTKPGKPMTYNDHYLLPGDHLLLHHHRAHGRQPGAGAGRGHVHHAASHAHDHARLDPCDRRLRPGRQGGRRLHLLGSRPTASRSRRSARTSPATAPTSIQLVDGKPSAASR